MSVISFAFLSGQVFTWMIAAAHAWIVSGLTKKNAVAQHLLLIIVKNRPAVNTAPVQGWFCRYPDYVHFPVFA